MQNIDWKENEFVKRKMPSLPNKRQRWDDAESIFLNVPLWKKCIKEKEAISYQSGLTANIEIKESNDM